MLFFLEIKTSMESYGIKDIHGSYGLELPWLFTQILTHATNEFHGSNKLLFPWFIHWSMWKIMIPRKLVYVAFMEQVTSTEVTCYYVHDLFMDPCKIMIPRKLLHVVFMENIPSTEIMTQFSAKYKQKLKVSRNSME